MLGAIAASIYLIAESRGGVESATVSRDSAQIISLAVAQVPGGTVSGPRPLRIALAALVAGVLLAPSSASAGSNDTMATADGPVIGSITGAIETENDVDWFFFYAQGSTQLDISLAGLGPAESCYTGGMST